MTNTQVLGLFDRFLLLCWVALVALGGIKLVELVPGWWALLTTPIILAGALLILEALASLGDPGC